MRVKHLSVIMLAVVLIGCTPPAQLPVPPPTETAATEDEESSAARSDEQIPPEQLPETRPEDSSPLPSEVKPVEEPEPLPAITPGTDPLIRIDVVGKQVILTFDDGPSRYTEEILKILAEEGIQAVFFFLGHAEHVPELARKVVELGHQVGTHTLNHLRLPDLKPEQWQAEILAGKEILERISGDVVSYFRPPYGRRTQEIMEFAAEQGLVTVLWDIDSRDWELAENPEQIVENVLSQVRPGSIILLHERPQTVEVLPELIAALREAGFTFEPLPPVILPGEEGEGIQIPPPESLFYANTERDQEILSLVNPPEQAEDTPDDTK